MHGDIVYRGILLFETITNIVSCVPPHRALRKSIANIGFCSAIQYGGVILVNLSWVIEKQQIAGGGLIGSPALLCYTQPYQKQQRRNMIHLCGCRR